MAVFTYNPDNARTWANSVVNYLNGGSDSINYCSVKFNEQIEKLVQPNVWTGDAAYKNYENFLETHQALINFVNKFGEAFQNSMNSVNASVANLEVSNLGSNTNVSSNFGTLSYAQLSQLSTQNINRGEVRYDYATISEIGTELKRIYENLQTIKDKLTSKINELNSNAAIWDGSAAENAKQNLLGVLKSGMDAINFTLTVCINNISSAAEAARMADSAQ